MTACLCWTGPPIYHAGHCCLRDGWDDDADRMVCGHDEQALTAGKGTS